MSTKTMTLEALTEEYLIARVLVAEARRALKSAEGRSGERGVDPPGVAP